MGNMIWLVLSISCLLGANANEITVTADKLKEAFRVFRIVPQIIPEAPETALSEIYGDCKVDLGNMISTCCTRIQPFTTWINARSNLLYTIIFFDPDAPQYFNSNGTQSLHVLVVNVPGLNIERADVLSPYVAPSPPPGSGYHRYICLVYRQQFPITVTTELLISVSTSRRSFSVIDFVKRFKLGNPVAGNFFRTRQSSRDSAPCKHTSECCVPPCYY